VAGDIRTVVDESRREVAVEVVAGMEVPVEAKEASFKVVLAGLRGRMLVLGTGKILGATSWTTVCSGQAKGAHMTKQDTGIRVFSGTMLSVMDVGMATTITSAVSQQLHTMKGLPVLANLQYQII
jgi:hypothetical protein